MVASRELCLVDGWVVDLSNPRGNGVKVCVCVCMCVVSVLTFLVSHSGG